MNNLKFKIKRILKQNKNLINILTGLGILFSITFLIWGISEGIFKSQKNLDIFLENIGIMGPIVFIIIQIVQVVIPIIPGGVTSIGGVFIFGPVKGTIYNYVGIVTGSYINYFLARYYGVEFVGKLIGQKKFNKYTKYLNKGKKFDRFFAMAIAIPISPDDILCLFAGLVRMSFFKFTLVIIFLKPIGLLMYTLGGNIILKKFLLNW